MIVHEEGVEEAKLIPAHFSFQELFRHACQANDTLKSRCTESPCLISGVRTRAGRRRAAAKVSVSQVQDFPFPRVLLKS